MSEVRLGAQRALDAGRRHLEAVGLRDRVVDVEHRRQLARHLLARAQVDVVGLAVAVGEREVDLDPECPPALLEQEAQVDQLEAGRPADGLDDGDQALLERVSGHGCEVLTRRRPKKKVADRPPLPRSD